MTRIATALLAISALSACATLPLQDAARYRTLPLQEEQRVFSVENEAQTAKEANTSSGSIEVRSNIPGQP